VGTPARATSVDRGDDLGTADGFLDGSRAGLRRGSRRGADRSHPRRAGAKKRAEIAAGIAAARSAEVPTRAPVDADAVAHTRQVQEAIPPGLRDSAAAAMETAAPRPPALETTPPARRITEEPPLPRAWHEDEEPTLRMQRPAVDEETQRMPRPVIDEQVTRRMQRAVDEVTQRIERPATGEEVTQRMQLPISDEEPTQRRRRPEPDEEPTQRRRRTEPDEQPTQPRRRPDDILELKHLPEATVMMDANPTSREEARVNYGKVILADPTREVGLFFNPETGVYVVVQGTGHSAEGGAMVLVGHGATGEPEGPRPGGQSQRWKEILDADVGRWQLVAHYHPGRDPNVAGLTRRLPTGLDGDFGLIVSEAYESGGLPRESRIHFRHEGRWGYTDFGYNPRLTEGRFWIDVENPVTGRRQQERFNSLDEFEAWVARATGRPRPPPSGGTPEGGPMPRATAAEPTPPRPQLFIDIQGGPAVRPDTGQPTFLPDLVASTPGARGFLIEPADYVPGYAGITTRHQGDLELARILAQNLPRWPERPAITATNQRDRNFRRMLEQNLPHWPEGPPGIRPQPAPWDWDPTLAFPTQGRTEVLTRPGPTAVPQAFFPPIGGEGRLIPIATGGRPAQQDVIGLQPSRHPELHGQVDRAYWRRPFALASADAATLAAMGQELGRMLRPGGFLELRLLRGGEEAQAHAIAAEIPGARVVVVPARGIRRFVERNGARHPDLSNEEWAILQDAARDVRGEFGALGEGDFQRVVRIYRGTPPPGGGGAPPPEQVRAMAGPGTGEPPVPVVPRQIEEGDTPLMRREGEPAAPTTRPVPEETIAPRPLAEEATGRPPLQPEMPPEGAVRTLPPPAEGPAFVEAAGRLTPAGLESEAARIDALRAAVGRGDIERARGLMDEIVRSTGADLQAVREQLFPLPKELRPGFTAAQLSREEARQLAVERWKNAEQAKKEFGRRLDEARQAASATERAERQTEVLAEVARQLELAGPGLTDKIFNDMVDWIIQEGAKVEQPRYKGRRPATEALVDALRERRAMADTDLKGHVLASVLEENIEAVRQIRERIAELQPDAVFGVKRGGAFLIDVLATGDADLTQISAQTEKHKSGKRTLDLEARIRAAIEKGQRSFVIVDYYMGGHAASEFIDMYRRIIDSERDLDLRFESIWMRERFGYERNEVDQSGERFAHGRLEPQTEVAEDLVGKVHQTVVPVTYVLGDDMKMIFNPKSTDPIVIFDSRGQVVQRIPVGTPHPATGQPLMTPAQILIALMQGYRFAL
jgi:hypothetical protein